jgi:hypothetical protein
MKHEKSDMRIDQTEYVIDPVVWETAALLRDWNG